MCKSERVKSLMDKSSLECGVVGPREKPAYEFQIYNIFENCDGYYFSLVFL